MAQASDVFRFCIKGKLLEQDWTLCVDFQIDNLAGVWTAQRLGTFYNTEVVDNLMSKLSNKTTANTLVVENLTDPNEFAELSIEQSGTRTGDTLPAFVAYGMTKVRTTRATKSGGMRIPGVIEDALDTSGNITSGYLAEMNSAFDTNINFVDGADNCQMGMVIVGRDLQGKLDLTKINPVSSVVFSRITTQNSRKRYKGD